MAKTKRDIDPDERIVIPLEPELAIRALLRVDPDAPPADDEQSPKSADKQAD